MAHEWHRSVLCTVIWHAAVKTTREINAAVNTQKNQETILVMRPKFNFNQWWEAQSVSRPTQNINAYRKDRQNRKCRNTVPQSGIAPRKVHAACSQQQRARLWEAVCQSWSSSDFSWYPYSLKYEPRQINCFSPFCRQPDVQWDEATQHSRLFWRWYSAPGSPQIKTKLLVPL